MEVKILIMSDELSENYKTWEKQWFINNNLRNPTNEDVKNDITANCIKQKIESFLGNIEFITFILTNSI